MSDQPPPADQPPLVDQPTPTSHLLLGRLGLLLLLLLAANGARLIVAYGAHDVVHPVDAYFYLAKAESLAAGQGLRTYWNDGGDRMFFPLQSIALAPFSLLRGAWPRYWLILSVALYLLNALVLARLLRILEAPGLVQFGTLALWLANPNILLWHSVPYAESLASLLGWSAVLVFADQWRTGPAWRLAAAGLLAGLALTARAEAILLPLVFGIVILVQLAQGGRSAVPWRRVALAAGLFVLPFALYWLSLSSTAEGARQAYVGVSIERFELGNLWDNFQKLFFGILLEIGIDPRGVLGNYFPALTTPGMMRALGAAQLLIHLTHWLSLAAALLGRLGRPARWAAVTLLGYQALHSFWFYSYGRFNFVVVPLAAYVVASGAHHALALLDKMAYARLSGQERPVAPGSWATAVGGLGLLLAAGMMSLYGAVAIDRQQYFLEREAGMPPRERLEAILMICANLRPDEMYLVVDDLWLAYEVGSRGGGRAWYTQSRQEFFEQAFGLEEGWALMRREGVRLVATRLSKDECLERLGVPEREHQMFHAKHRAPGGYGLLEWRELR